MNTPNQNPNPQPAASNDERRDDAGRRRHHHHHHESCHGPRREERPERRDRNSRNFSERDFGPRGFGPRGFGPRGFDPRGFGPHDFSSRSSDRRNFGPRGTAHRAFDRRDLHHRDFTNRDLTPGARSSRRRGFEELDLDLAPDHGPDSRISGPRRRTRSDFANRAVDSGHRMRGASSPRTFNRRDLDPSTTHHGPSTPPAPHNADSHTTCDHHRDARRARREDRRAAHRNERNEPREQHGAAHRKDRAAARAARPNDSTHSTRDSRRLTPDQRADLRATQVALTSADRALRKLTAAYAAAVSATNPTHRDQARAILANARRDLRTILHPEA